MPEILFLAFKADLIFTAHPPTPKLMASCPILQMAMACYKALAVSSRVRVSLPVRVIPVRLFVTLISTDGKCHLPWLSAITPFPVCCPLLLNMQNPVRLHVHFIALPVSQKSDVTIIPKCIFLFWMCCSHWQWVKILFPLALFLSVDLFLIVITCVLEFHSDFELCFPDNWWHYPFLGRCSNHLYFCYWRNANSAPL